MEAGAPSTSDTATVGCRDGPPSVLENQPPMIMARMISIAGQGPQKPTFVKVQLGSALSLAAVTRDGDRRSASTECSADSDSGCSGCSDRSDRSGGDCTRCFACSGGQALQRARWLGIEGCRQLFSNFRARWMSLLDPHHRRWTGLNLRGKLLAAHPQRGPPIGDQEAIDGAAVGGGLRSRSEPAHPRLGLGPVRRSPLRRLIARPALRWWMLRLAQGQLYEQSRVKLTLELHDFWTSGGACLG